MKMVPNPEYEDAPFEAACLDKDGNKLSEMYVCILFGRPRPPRYRQLPDGSLEEVFSHVPEKDH